MYLLCTAHTMLYSVTELYLCGISESTSTDTRTTHKSSTVCNEELQNRAFICHLYNEDLRG